MIQQGENELEAARAKARTLAQQVETQAYALTDELRQLQKDDRMSAQQKAQRAREIAKRRPKSCLPVRRWCTTPSRSLCR